MMSASVALADALATQALNDLRTRKGRAPLIYSEMLASAAQAHADDMASRRFFAHQGSNGSRVGDRINATGYRWCLAAENIAKGQRDLRQVMRDWTKSRGHFRNMIQKNATEFGLARAKGNLWVMVLANRC
jgi:uncharacterized protein YkwD